MNKEELKKYYEHLQKKHIPVVDDIETDFWPSLKLPTLPNKRVSDFLKENGIEFEVKFGNSYVSGHDILPITNEVNTLCSKSGEENFMPEYLLAVDMHAPSGELVFCVKFKDRDDSHNKWLPMKELADCKHLIVHYFELVDRKRIKWNSYLDAQGNAKEGYIHFESESLKKSQESSCYLDSVESMFDKGFSDSEF